MPGIDGVLATRLINKEMPNVKIIALTSYYNEELVKSAYEAGVVDYITKDKATAELEDVIHAAYKDKNLISPSNSPNRNGIYKTQQKLLELTGRERDVLELMVKGFTNADIANELVISYSTVKKHVHNILNKFGTTNRTEAVALAYQNQLVRSG